MKPLNEYSFTEFKSLILNASKKHHENWFFSQSRDSWFADYRPNYPEKTAADFTIAFDHSRPVPRITIYQDTALLPTIVQFSNVQELTTALYYMD